jgi:hypothetical protein
MEKQRGARADENGDVAERRVEFYYRRAPAPAGGGRGGGGGVGLYDGVGVPVAPDDLSAAGEVACFVLFCFVCFFFGGMKL